MAKPGKKIRASREKIGEGKVFPPGEGLQLVKDCAGARFDETVDVCVKLGVDPRKSDQVVRGSTVLPHGTGKKVRVAVFAEGQQAEAAKSAGADLVGLDDLAEQVKQGQIDFDVAIATPDTMKVVGKLGQILGPRGLMPNPKVGTVTPNVEAAVENVKAGQVRFKTDRAGLIHCTIGKATFEAKALEENLSALLADLVKAKPASAKGIYIKKVTVSSTMGPGVQVDQATLA